MAAIDDDDIELFRITVGNVKPVVNDLADTNKPPAEAIPRQLQQDERQAIEDLQSGLYDAEHLSLGDEIQFHRPGLQHNVLRKLRRGHYRIHDEIDLHGLTGAEAKQALAAFINQALIHQQRCVRVIHGKGLRSSNEGPVLKPLVVKWLMQQKDVVAFCTARAIDGGTGALYVLLKK